MMLDESNEMLRKIIYDRGFSAEQVHAASDELQRRLHPDAPDDSMACSAASPTDHDADSVVSDPALGRPRRGGGVVRVAAIAALSCGLGIAGTLGYLGTQHPAADQNPDGAAPAAQPNVPETATTSVIDSDTGETLYQTPGTPTGFPLDLGNWLTSPQFPADVLAYPHDNIDSSSVRLAGHIGTDGKVWIARATNEDVCLVVAPAGANNEIADLWTCVDEHTFNFEGAALTTGKYTVSWNPWALNIGLIPLGTTINTDSD